MDNSIKQLNVTATCLLITPDKKVQEVDIVFEAEMTTEEMTLANINIFSIAALTMQKYGCHMFKRNVAKSMINLIPESTSDPNSDSKSSSKPLSTMYHVFYESGSTHDEHNNIPNCKILNPIGHHIINTVYDKEIQSKSTDSYQCFGNCYIICINTVTNTINNSYASLFVYDYNKIHKTYELNTIVGTVSGTVSDTSNTITNIKYTPKKSESNTSFNTESKDPIASSTTLNSDQITNRIESDRLVYHSEQNIIDFKSYIPTSSLISCQLL